VLPLDHCSCHHFLGDQPVIDYECRQVFELPKPKLKVTEYRAEIKKCTRCGKISTAAFFENVTAPAQYGERLKSFLLYLHYQHFIPAARVSQLCSDLFGYPVSEGVLFKQIQTCTDRLTDFETDLIEHLKTEPVLNVDETGLNVSVDGKWLHSASTDYLTFYGIHQKRGQIAMDEFGIIPNFNGTLVHDFYVSYFNYDCNHAFCNAHLLRELKFLHEERNQQWAKDMSDLLLEANNYVKEQKPVTNKLSERKKKPWIHRYRKIVSEGEKANPLIETQNSPSKRGRKKRTIEQNLLARFRIHENSILKFLHDFRVPFTNNLAEQDIRMMKVRQKISGCFRTINGARSFSRIRSYLSTCRKNGLDVLQSITDALNGQVSLEKIIS
jgi:transposase